MFDYARAFVRLNRDVKLYLAAFGMVAFGYFGVMGVLFNLYLARLGFGTEFIGLLIGSGQLIWGISALPAGVIGARLGLSRVLVVAQVVTALGIALILLAEWLPRPLWATGMIVSWMLLWVGAALFTVNGVPFLMAATAPEERMRAFSLQQAVIALFGFAGSVVGGWLPGAIAAGDPLDAVHYRMALWLAPICFVAAALFCGVMRRIDAPARHSDRDASDAPPIPLYLFFVAVVFLGASGDGAARNFFNLYLDSALHISTSQIGAAMGVAQLLPVVLALLTPLLLARLGTAMTMIAATLAAAFCIALMGLVPHWLVATVALMGIQGAVAVVSPARNLFSQEIVPPHRRTTTAALTTIGLALGWSLSAGFGGYVIESLGFRTFYLIIALLSLASALLLIAYMRRTKPAPASMATGGD